MLTADCPNSACPRTISVPPPGETSSCTCGWGYQTDAIGMTRIARPEGVDAEPTGSGDDPTIEAGLIDLVVLPLKPGDVLVILHPNTLDQRSRAMLIASWQQEFPRNRVRLLDGGASLAVVRPEGVEETAEG
jgi:hypothetical protein